MKQFTTGEVMAMQNHLAIKDAEFARGKAEGIAEERARIVAAWDHWRWTMKESEGKFSHSEGERFLTAVDPEWLAKLKERVT